VRETYLDWNATAPLRPEAAAAIEAALALGGNPSSVHRSGRAARRIVERARERVAALAGMPESGIVFTSGGTEANNLALAGAGRARVLVSAVEHPSVLQAVPQAEVIPVDRDGIVDLAWIDRALAADPRPALVSVMFANNETGVIEPLAEVVAIAHRHGALVHCDAVQAAGKLPLGGLGADLVTLSAHKLGGPMGVGALAVADGVELAPLLRGGGQERGRRAGSENLAGIAGFGAVAEVGDWSAVAALRDRLEAGLAAPAAVVGAGAPRLPNTSAIALPGIAAETQVIALDLAGVMVSAGAACSSGKVGPSHVLQAMGLPPDIAACTIRVSLGWSTGAADIAHFLDAWNGFRNRVESRAA
jgi:cysteine desulfurase